MKQLSITNRLTNRETESFKKYLREIAEIDVFTPAEEIICTEKANNGDKEALQELVRRNLRFVVTVAKQYATTANPLEDLVNEGNIGLIMAAEKFDPKKGWRFISYAVWWIQKIILEHLAMNGRMVRLPNNKINSLSKLDKRINQMEQKLGRPVDIKEVIDEMHIEMGVEIAYDEAGLPIKNKINEEFFDLSMLSTYNMDSLDREISSHDGNHTTLSDMIADDTTFKSTDHLIIDSDIKLEVARMLESLKPRDKRIMIAMYGLDGNSPMTLKEIGDEVGVTREMVRQIKEKTLKKLKLALVNSTIRSCQ